MYKSAKKNFNEKKNFYKKFLECKVLLLLLAPKICIMALF